MAYNKVWKVKSMVRSVIFELDKWNEWKQENFNNKNYSINPINKFVLLSASEKRIIRSAAADTGDVASSSPQQNQAVQTLFHQSPYVRRSLKIS